MNPHLSLLLENPITLGPLNNVLKRILVYLGAGKVTLFTRYNQVKMRSYWIRVGSKTKMTHVLIRRERNGQRHRYTGGKAA